MNEKPKDKSYEAIIEYGGYALCPECKSPMLYSFNHICCCKPGCALRGVRFKRPAIALHRLADPQEEV